MIRKILQTTARKGADARRIFTARFMKFINVVPARHYDKLMRDHEKLLLELNNSKQKFAEQIAIAEKNIDYHFKANFQQYIENEVLPRAQSIKQGGYDGATYVKFSRSRYFQWNGMSAYQNFSLELDSISRINKAMLELGEDKHFPLLVDFSTEELSITYSHEGTSLSELKEHVRILDLDRQIEAIQAILEKSKVIYLDMHPSGKNLVVNCDGIISVIDFDMTKPDGIAFNQTINQKLEIGDGLISRERIARILESSPYVSLD